MSSAAKMRAGGGLGIAAPLTLPGAVDDLAGFRAIAQALEGDDNSTAKRVSHLESIPNQSAINRPEVIRRILACLGFPAR